MPHRLEHITISTFRCVILFCTLAFRLFLVAVVMAFLQQRHGWTEGVILAGAVTALIALFSAFFTLRRVCGWGGNIEQAWGVAYTIACSILALGYAVGIQMSVGYWGYTAFGVFVAALFALDLVLIRPTAHA